MRSGLLLLVALALAGCTEPDMRGQDAVNACRPHGGVAALDDTVVVCNDQTVVEVEEIDQ